MPFSWRAQTSPTWRPTSTEPVKKTLATEERASASPTAPPPWTTRTRPSGTPPRSNTARIFSPSSGVSEAGFSTTPLPAISAIATSPKGIDQG